LADRTPPPGVIEVWRSAWAPTAELRAGTAVSAPYPRHWHEEYQFCSIEDGGGSVDCRGRRRQTPSRSLFVIHPGEAHSNEATPGETCSFRSLYLAPELFPGTPYFPEIVLDDERTIRDYRRLWTALTSPSRLEAEGRLAEFVECMRARHGESKIALLSPDNPDVDRRQVGRARELIDARYVENLSLAELADEAGMQPFRFHRAFRRLVGMPPHAYQTQVRVSRAKRLLRAGVPVATVAAETGFADQSHLSRHFRRLVLLTPGRYARGCKNVQD